MAVLLQSQGMYKEFSGPLFAPGTPTGDSLGIHLPLHLLCFPLVGFMVVILLLPLPLAS